MSADEAIQNCIRRINSLQGVVDQIAADYTPVATSRRQDKAIQALTQRHADANAELTARIDGLNCRTRELAELLAKPQTAASVQTLDPATKSRIQELCRELDKAQDASLAISRNLAPLSLQQTYKVIECSHHVSLQLEVQDHLIAGWTLQGGVCTLRHEPGATYYAQAMVKVVSEAPAPPAPAPKRDGGP